MIKNQLLSQYFANIYYNGCSNCKINCHLCETKETFLTIYEYKRVHKYFPIYFKQNNNQAYIYMSSGSKCIYHTREHLCRIYDDRLDMCKRYPFNFFEEDGEFIFEFYDMLCHGVSEGQVIKNSFAIVEGNDLSKQAKDTFVGSDYKITMEQNCTLISDFVIYLHTNDLLISSDILSQFGDDLLHINQNKIDTIDDKYKELAMMHISSLSNLYLYQK